MAKGSLIGISKGRLGNSVLYRNSNSNNSELQGRRVYVPTIKNPKSAGQCSQRVKLAPAVNFYRAFKDEVLNHSFQGVKYGGRSQAEFMKLAMLMNSGFPYVIKGTTDLIPGEYRVSRGSLPGIQVSALINGTTGEDTPLRGVQVALSFETPTQGQSFASWITDALRDNPQLQKGDQITLMVVMNDGDNYPIVRRIILDESKYVGTTCDEVWAESGLEIGSNTITLAGWSVASAEVIAGAVIVSRPNYSTTSGTLTWDRSNATMFVSADITAQYMSTDAKAAAEASYSSSSKSPNSKFYLNQGTTGF